MFRTRGRSGGAVLACLALAAAGCGQREATVLEQALEQEIGSAQLVVEMRATEGPQRRFLQSFRLSGPYRSNGPDRIESFDLAMRGAGHHGERFALRLISTGTNMFVRTGGETYEVGERRVARLNRQRARQRRAEGQVDDLDDVERLGVDLRAWFPRSDRERDGTVAGVPTAHLSGRLDVSAMLRDADRLLRNPAIRSQLQASGRLPQLGPEEIRRIDRSITDPRFDVHVGRPDGKLRRIAGALRFRIPPAQRETAAFGDLTMALELRDVDRPVRIDAPERGRPIEELTRPRGRRGTELQTAAARTG